MSRALSVKVATPKVITALETKLAKLKSDKANYGIARKQFEEAHSAWKNNLKTLYSTGEVAEVEVTGGWRVPNDKLAVQVTYYVDKSSVAERPTEPQAIGEWQFKEMVEDIENALNILRMTEDEYVNATTMKSIAKYL